MGYAERTIGRRGALTLPCCGHRTRWSKRLTAPAESDPKPTKIAFPFATNRSLNDFHTSRLLPCNRIETKTDIFSDQSGKSRRGCSSSPWNEPRDARLYNRIEPDSCSDTFTNFFDGVVGKSRDIKILLDVADACSCGERSRDALYGPGQ